MVTGSSRVHKGLWWQKAEWGLKTLAEAMPIGAGALSCWHCIGSSKRAMLIMAGAGLRVVLKAG